MKNIAKMLSLLLAVVLVLGITACGGSCAKTRRSFVCGWKNAI